MKIAVKLLVRARIAALVQVVPNRNHGGNDAGLTQAVVDDCQQIFVNAEQNDAIQVGQHTMQDDLLCLLRIGMKVQFDLLFFTKQIGRHHQHGRVYHNQRALVGLRQDVVGAQCLTQVGSHRNAAVDGVLFKYHLRLIVGGSKHQTAFTHSDYQSAQRVGLFVCCHAFLAYDT